MSDTNSTFGKIAGKVKEVAGSVVGNRDLEAEGRLQQAAVEADDRADETAAKAAQERREAELEAAAEET